MGKIRLILLILLFLNFILSIHYFINKYDEALAHIANQNIEIDLDDGVKVNYAKFQNIEVSKEGKKSKKINLLKKL